MFGMLCPCDSLLPYYQNLTLIAIMSCHKHSLELGLLFTVRLGIGFPIVDYIPIYIVNSRWIILQLRLPAFYIFCRPRKTYNIRHLTIAMNYYRNIDSMIADCSSLTAERLVQCPTSPRFGFAGISCKFLSPTHF